MCAGRLAATVADASADGTARVIQWMLLGTYAGPLDKYDWPELSWLCERKAVGSASASIMSHKRSAKRIQIVDLKPLVASELHPEMFEQCPMVRREMYGLAAGGGIHWGPALHDAWTQFFLRELCS